MNEVALRRLSFADARSLAVLANNKNVWDNVRDIFPHPYDLADASAFIEMKAQESQELTFGIHYNGDFCGVIGLEPQADVYRFNAEIGYWLGEPFWRKGIATQAVKTISDHAFGELKLRRLFAGIFAGNIGSMRVLEKAGFSLETTIEDGAFKNGNFVDTLQYGLTLTSWTSQKSV